MIVNANKLTRITKKKKVSHGKKNILPVYQLLGTYGKIIRFASSNGIQNVHWMSQDGDHAW
jgi:phage gp45-like